MGEEDLNEDEKEAGHLPHHCTDVLCLLIFASALSLLGFILHYAFVNGDIRRLYHGLDFYGDLCGVDENVLDKPYLYWCGVAEESPSSIITTGTGSAPLFKPTAELDLLHPICVSACPIGNQTFHSCYQDRTAIKGVPDPITGTFKEDITYTFALVQDYESFHFAAGYCFPRDEILVRQVRKVLDKSLWTKLMQKVPEISHAWMALVMAAVLAIILGFLYLYILDVMAGPLVYGCLIIATLGPGIIGGTLVYASHNGGLERVQTTGSNGWDLAFGIVLLIFAFLVAMVAICCRRSIQLAVGSVEAACDCMFDMPTILFEPCLNLFLKVSVLVLMGVGFAWLLSVGEVERHDITQYIPGGISRSFTYDENQTYFIIYYVFALFWALELCTATAQFVLAYSTQLWFFREYTNGKKNVPSMPLTRGYAIALKYHLGTLAFGSFLIATLRLVRMVLSFIANQGKAEGNGIVRVAAGCCSCCVMCFERFIRFVNKNAYMCVAVNSESFCEAAVTAFRVIANEVAGIAILNGACWIFQMAGMAAIASAGVLLTWTLIGTMDIFVNPASDHFVEDPVLVCGVAAIICIAIASSFMTVFDTVADTMLFCWAIDRQHRVKNALPSKNYTPPRLKALLDDLRTD